MQKNENQNIKEIVLLNYDFLEVQFCRGNLLEELS